MTPLDALWLAGHPLPEPGHDTDKNKRGRVLAAGGAASVPGALLLTGEAALRAGAGKLQMASVESAAAMLGLLLPEAASFALPTGSNGELAAAAGDALLGHAEHCDTLVLGPGMGPDAPAAAILERALARPSESLSIVLDAAAAAGAHDCVAAIRAHDGRVVLTPHPGEMAALMACDADAVTAAPRDHAERAAERFGATIVLKLAESWIATPGAPTLHYPGGGPGLATGGSGDVLAGIIAGLLSRGAEPHVAAAWGVWLHGEAGRRVAERSGPLGFLARELLAEIPRLMALSR